MTLNADFALTVSKYMSQKRFICLKSILQNLNTILHIQFNHHTLTVTPFNDDLKLFEFDDLKLILDLKHYFLLGEINDLGQKTI